MKTILHSVSACLIFTVFLSFSPGCKAIKTDNGKHKGWFKNPNNPHNPLTTNPGHTKGKGKKK